MVAGRTSARELPADRFLECDFEGFELAASTTQALLSLPIPIGGKVLLTVLKKVFVQRGAGRREGALTRGLDAKARSVLPGVLSLLRRQGFLLRTRQGTETVWLPAKDPDVRRRALEILAAPVGASDPVLKEARDIS